MPQDIQTQLDNLQKQITAIRTNQVLPIHSHNGIDSNRILFSNLQNANRYLTLNMVTLSSAQILALHTTPVNLVPTLSGYFIIVEGIFAKLTYGGTAYANNNNLQFFYTNASGSKVSADMGFAFLNSSATAYDYVGGVISELTPVISTPVVVSVPTANPITGNSILTFVTRYWVVSI